MGHTVPCAVQMHLSQAFAANPMLAAELVSEAAALASGTGGSRAQPGFRQQVGTIRRALLQPPAV